MRKLYPYFLLVLSVLNCTQSKAQVNKNDSLALVDLFNSTNGPGWSNHTNWLTSAPLKNWYGIDVINNRVVNMYLNSNSLSGIIPSSFGNLTSLSYVELSQNELNASIPSSFGNLVNLTSLYLASNNLSGSIPSSLGSLTKLSNLALGYNNLSGNIPSFLGSIISLSNLALNGNQFSGRIPSALGNLSNLFYIDLGDNKLTGAIPSSFSNLLNLRSLNLYQNQLSGRVNAAVNNLSNLSELILFSNHLSGNISFLSNLKNLQTLDLRYNEFSGNIPVIPKLPQQYIYLFISYNKLSGSINHQFDSLSSSSLKLDISNNKFTFSGAENIAAIPYVIYAPQANINIMQNDNLLSVDAGGTISNNTYKWYRNGKLYRTKVGNANITASNDGAYTVEVTNSLATQLTLKSDTVNYAAVNNLITSAASNTLKSAYIFPNPATTVTTVYFTAIGKYTVTVTDASGKVMKTKTDVAANYHNYIQLEVNGYASGIYIINIIDEKNNMQTLRLIKQ